ncbi:vascular-related unknown protein 1 [Punica granatum]|uniref:Uncharacterized protein n=1 Tax=Punica granatum TaxID=22663 RepID=A0A6P8DGD7_PUNGR|nr:vascular-related unknown protein 1 [Punica granatum]
MEDSASLHSMKGRPSLSSRGTTLTDHHGRHEEEEESGWTIYLEDFSKHQSSSDLEHHISSSFSILGTSSLISDAASRYHDRANSGPGGSHPYCFGLSAGPKKLSLVKKMRAKKISEEDPLEDTASSPVSSPKVDDYKRMDMTTIKADDNFGPNFFANGGSSNQHQGLKMETADGRKRDDQMVLNKGQNISDPCTSLKNRGLRLVPLSLIANYPG